VTGVGLCGIFIPDRSGINIPHTPTLSYFIDLPMKMEPIKCSETSAFSTQTPGRCPKENALHIKHGESLKSRRPSFSRTIMHPYVKYAACTTAVYVKPEDSYTGLDTVVGLAIIFQSQADIFGHPMSTQCYCHTCCTTHVSR